MGCEVDIIITGQLTDGTYFEGIDVIRVIDRGEGKCMADFDVDNDIDGTDASKFKDDFGRSEFHRPCNDDDECPGDFDCDGDCDGGDASKFKEEFGRNAFKDPCPPPC